MTVIGCSECGTMGYCARHMGPSPSDLPTSTYKVTFTVEVQATGEYEAEVRARSAVADIHRPVKGVVQKSEGKKYSW